MATMTRPGLTAARERLGLNQTQAAERSGIHRVQWVRYETGKMTPNVDLAIRMASALDTTVEELWSPLSTAPGAKAGRSRPEETNHRAAHEGSR